MGKGLAACFILACICLWGLCSCSAEKNGTFNEYADFKEWYPRKMLRDMYARKGYKDMEKEAYRRGELYISRIIDEEMKKDDLRI